jgi:subtilisin family serine protease
VAARVPGAVSVGAINRAKGHAPYSTSGSYVELAAPGGEFGSFGAGGGILQQTLNLALTETSIVAVELRRRGSMSCILFAGTRGHTSWPAWRRC